MLSNMTLAREVKWSMGLELSQSLVLRYELCHPGSQTLIFFLKTLRNRQAELDEARHILPEARHFVDNSGRYTN